VIPAYNRAQKALQAALSVLAQSFTDLEVIVVDDGSTDGTEQLLRQELGERIRYFFQTNQGASAARNKGIMEAHGEWIAFLDSDDVWEPDKLEWQLRVLKRFAPECGACYTDVRFFNHTETSTVTV
jgi:glycosyltransferase involved in cell wall biosynthesis